ncbi:thermonuclease family protein [Mesorhizobium sp. YIM 152430]|uniref:thermonuclease family protein n=1 Tax=Mesorhizobium sp. YIM 152430 TaxID=3031761 RepID=UPI0023DCEA1B|nr:thermonuclease family protein [Mesorhizobium sp. YIM 152430]MDF1600875.1 thermonuclease family protein [Mesorhizobium sp. YIM 152430]
MSKTRIVKILGFKRKKRKPGRPVLVAMALLAAASVGYHGPDLLRNSVPDLIPSIVPARSTKIVASSSFSSQTLSGRASVIDGDTIEIRGERIRLDGIDAPESSQTCNDAHGVSYRCGAQAAEALAEMLAASSPTSCDYVDRDQYGRYVGNCYLADGNSVQAAMVRSGWAMDWPRYSGGEYASEQQTARGERIGIWTGSVKPPWEWRADRRRAKPPTRTAPLVGAASPSGGCEIKGNVASHGERIYHVPGQQHYEKTQINTAKGERWFCSEAEARDAGWRAARR